ncbi:unnamed protein product [Closterium sp. NIES-65]|nr:unnamed protein product [Closterium sp. NIES-65]
MTTLQLVRFLGIVWQGYLQMVMLPVLNAVGTALPTLVSAFTLRQTRVFVLGDRLDARVRWFRLITSLPEYTFYEYLRRVWNLQQSRTRMIVEQVNERLKTKWRILDGRLECDVIRAPQVVSICIVLHNIDLILGFRHRLNEPRERYTWWLEGPVAEAPHFSPRDAGFTPTRRRSRLAAYFYASWRLGHLELSQPSLGYVLKTHQIGPA